MSVLAQNPISPVGTYIADPSARVWNDGWLYIYGSTDDGVGHWCSHKHDVLYTCDLKHWNIRENVFSTVGTNDQVEEIDDLLFAPDVMYRNGKYYMYFCTPNTNYSEGVASSSSPLGPFHGAQKLNVGQYTQIDPTVLVDDDGQAYFYWGQKNLKCGRLKSNMMELDSTSIRDNILNSDEHFFHEGAFAFKRKGIYYILFADESRRDQRPTCLGYATASSPYGPFTYRGVVIDNFGCDPETWNNHGSVAEFNGQWYVFYHRSSHGSEVMRRACVEPIYFNDDGSIDEVEMTSQGAGKAFEIGQTIEAERACLLTGYCRIMKVSPHNEAVCSIKSGDGVYFKYFNFNKSMSRFIARLDVLSGGLIKIHLDGPDGRIIGAMNIPSDKTGQRYQDYSCNLDSASGKHALYIEFIGSERNSKLFNMDSFRIE